MKLKQLHESNELLMEAILIHSDEHGRSGIQHFGGIELNTPLSDIDYLAIEHASEIFDIEIGNWHVHGTTRIDHIGSNQTVAAMRVYLFESVDEQEAAELVIVYGSMAKMLADCLFNAPGDTMSRPELVGEYMQNESGGSLIAYSSISRDNDDLYGPDMHTH